MSRGERSDSANVQEDSETVEAHGIAGMIARIEHLDRTERHESQQPEIGMWCSTTYPHVPHNWQMSATGWCACDGRESTPIFDALRN